MAARHLLFLCFLSGSVPATFGATCSIGNLVGPRSSGHGQAPFAVYTQDPCNFSAFHLGGVNVLKEGQQVPKTTYMKEIVIGDDAGEIQAFLNCPEPCDIQPLGIGKAYHHEKDQALVFDQETTSTCVEDQIRLCPSTTQQSLSVDLGRPERVAGVLLQFESPDGDNLYPGSLIPSWMFYYGNHVDDLHQNEALSLDETATQSGSTVTTFKIMLEEVIVARYFKLQGSQLNNELSGCVLVDFLGCKALCQEPLGLSDGFIPDANIHISHRMINDFGPEQARPVAVGAYDYGRMWCAGEQGTEVDWIQVTLPDATTVSGVWVENTTEWSTAGDVFVEYQDQGGSWNTIYESLHVNCAEYFPQPVVTRKVRINIERSSSEDVCLRFELLGCRDCRDQLGMTDGSIPDSAITASSVQSDDEGPQYARMNEVIGVDGNIVRSWCANEVDGNPWISVDLQRPLPVTGVITKGALHKLWVKTFKVKYGNAADGALTSTGQVFAGNTDAHKAVTNIFDRPIVARYVRLVLLTWHGGPCIRFELLGCKACNDTLGMQDRTIGDEDITASSSKIVKLDVIKALRLGQPQPQLWLPSALNDNIWKHPRLWIQVDLGRATVVSGITLYCGTLSDITQWNTCSYMYTLKYGLDPSQLTHYLDERNRTMYFEGTVDKAKVTHFKPALYARFIQVSRLRYFWVGYQTIQVELWGCRGRCEDKMGIEDATIPDDRLTASSQNAEHSAHLARLHNHASWSPLSTDSHPWIQVNLVSDTVVSGVISQGGGLGSIGATQPQWVETYKVGYGNGWLETTMAESIRDVTDERGVTQVFSANYDGDTPVTNMFRQPVSARLVRLVPLSWHLAISMRLELMGCLSVCQERLGMEGGHILDHQISSSSSWNSQTHGPQRARLNQGADPELGLAGGWRADVENSTTEDMWIQVDFAQWTNLTGVITQGRQDKSEWVTEFKVSYLQNVWLFVNTPADGNPQEFIGNYGNYHLATNFFLHQVVARSVRVHPTNWVGRPSMRLELLGCTVRCQSQLGLEDGTIPDTAINASTRLLSVGFNPDQVRLVPENEYPLYSWYIIDVTEEAWIQVDFGERTQVTGIILQYLHFWRRCLASYHLRYATGDDLMRWTPILNGDKTKMFPTLDQIEAYRTDHYLHGERLISFFYSGVFARFIRLDVVTDNIRAVHDCPWLKFDFLGCRNRPTAIRTCQTLQQDGYLLDGTYQIDTDGIDQGQPPFQVTCKMAEGLTIIHHNAEDTFKLTPSAPSLGTSIVTMPYNISVEQIISVIDNSSTCEQMVKVECGESGPNAPLQQPAHQPVRWGSRSGEWMENWGTPTGRAGCTCGLKDACSTVGELCNCGVGLNRSSWEHDQGKLTDKNTLPVTLIRSYASQDVYVTVGPLKCKWPRYSHY